MYFRCLFFSWNSKHVHAWSARVGLNNSLHEIGSNRLLFHLTITVLTPIINGAAWSVDYSEAVDHTLAMGVFNNYCSKTF